MATKVTVEITNKGWVLQVINGDNIYKEEGVVTETGSSADTGGVDLEELEWVSDELYEALNSFFCHDVATALSDEEGDDE